jgi:hypothetical protein
LPSFVTSALLVILGFALGLIPSEASRFRRRLSHWNFLKVEIDACGQIARDLLNADEIVLSPLFRLPTTSYSTSFPALLADQALSEDEIDTLVKFFGHVHEINRGLDHAAEMHKLGEESKLLRERDRVSLKASKIVRSPGDDQPSLYERCLGIATKHSRMVPMQWKRGLARFWIVASVFWITGAGFFSLQHFAEVGGPHPIADGIEYLRSDGLGSAPLECGPVPAEEETLKGTLKTKLEWLRCEAARQAKAHRAEAWDRLKSIIALSVLPPIGTLFFGLALVWVWRGFRPPQAK